MARLAAAAARQRWRSVSIGHVRFPACPQFINGGTEEFRRSHVRDVNQWSGTACLTGNGVSARKAPEALEKALSMTYAFTPVEDS